MLIMANDDGDSKNGEKCDHLSHFKWSLNWQTTQYHPLFSSLPHQQYYNIITIIIIIFIF